MKQYRVAVINSPENRQLVKFHDLLIKYSTGYMIPLQLLEGDLIPLEVLDPVDVQKSLIVGSLGKYIRDKKVFVEDDAPLPQEEIKTETPKELPPIAKSKVEAEPKAETPLEPKRPAQDLKTEEKPLTNFEEVHTIEDFNRLAYFLRLRFVRESPDLELLKKISSCSDSLQLKNLIQFRLQK